MALLAVLLALAGSPASQAGRLQPVDSVLQRPVTLSLRNATLAEALGQLRHDQAVPLAWSGDLLPPDHRVTLTLTHEPLGAALATLLRGTGLSVVVTRLGTVVLVRAGAPVAERYPITTGVRELDRIVVIGTPVGGAPGREQPTAMTVVGDGALTRSPHSRTSDLMRTLLPGVVLWDYGPGGPPARITAVRGVSSFTTRGLKTYVDGVELASSDLFTLVDGRSIERIEVIRGPQGAALYGPDALNGILQIVTRKGQPGDEKLRARGAASVGPYERSDPDRTVAWQEYGLGLTGGASGASFDAGGGVSQAGSAGNTPWLRTWAVNAGGRVLAGPVVVSASSRAGRYRFAEERAWAPGSDIRHELEEWGAGVTAMHQLAARWRHTLVAGHHWISGPREPPAPTALVPSLPLGATHETAGRTSLRYSSAWDVLFGRSEATLSTGVEHARHRVERATRLDAVNRLSPLYEDELRSTGAFGQARLRLNERVILTGGSRAEWTSTVGENRPGPAWAWATGLTWTVPAGWTTVRLRGAWGRGIRPPEPGMRRGMATATVVQQANPDLVSEAQRGLELGLEAFIGERAWVRTTWYRQRADALIQQVAARTADATARTYQFQNVGAIDNTGTEFEAGVRLGRVELTGLAYFNRSEVLRTAAGYTGELAPGDRLTELPSSVGSMSVRYEAGRLRAEGGMSWLGSWTGYDWTVLGAVERGEQAERARARDYWMRYPAALRPHVAVAVELGRGFDGFVRMDNPTNRATLIRDNRSPPLGRMTVIGVELRP